MMTSATGTTSASLESARSRYSNWRLHSQAITGRHPNCIARAFAGVD
jgi:hypothetical protein